MKTLYLDCFAGVSGDMFIGALLDCGLDFELLKTELGRLGLPGYTLSLTRLDQSGISAAKFDVHLIETAVDTHTHEHHHEHKHEHSHSHSREHTHEHHHHEHSPSRDHSHLQDHTPDHSRDHEHEHSHDHSHSHDQAHSHSHSHEHGHSHTHEHSHDHDHEHGHRPLSEIKRLIESSELSERVKARALAIFQRIGEAEAGIHGMPIESVTFHEVGAVDSIVDIVGACIGLEALQIERVVSSPLHVGSGTFNCAHGTYPVPGPATTALLKGIPMWSGEIKGELVTPTGAAIVAEFASEYGPLPMMRVESVGYGAGTRKYPRFPNVLRAIIGYPEVADQTPTTVTVIEANIDDTNAQVFGHLMEQAMNAGALDLFYTPVQMKKNRPGILLTLLCAPADRARLTELIFRETTTLGVRWRDERREILRREIVTVQTAYGAIRIKVGRTTDNRVMNSAPEFEDCREAAEKHDVAVRAVQTAALTAWQQLSNS